MERFFTGRELVNTSSRLEWNAALLYNIDISNNPFNTGSKGLVRVHDSATPQ